MRIDREVAKEIKDKIKYLKKEQSSYCRKGQVLVQLWRDTGDVRLISTLHIEKCVEAENKKWKGETMKMPDRIKNCKINYVRRRKGRANFALLLVLQEIQEMD